MNTDKIYCDWVCWNESCPRHLANLEKIPKEEWEHISKAKFEDCPHYGSTAGMYVPM